VRQATAHATERDAAPDRRELETFSVQHTMGRTVLVDVRNAIGVHKSKGRLDQQGAAQRLVARRWELEQVDGPFARLAQRVLGAAEDSP